MRCARFPSLPLVPARALSIPAAALAAVLAALLLPGCDLFGSDEDDPGVEGVPPERLVAMVAVYDETTDDGAPVERLVVADFDAPAARYDVLEKAGERVATTCFSPDKRRILFADQTGSLVGTRSPLKLYDLDSGTVRDLDGAPTAATHGGTNERCLWSANGGGFYYQAAGAAGATYPVYYDLTAGEARPFGSMGIRFHGRKGRDSLLVSLGLQYEPEEEGASSFCFTDEQTKEVLKCLKNDHLKFIPWEDESRGGWKQAAASATYDNVSDRIAFMRVSEEERSLAVTDLEGSFVENLSTGGPLYMDLAWKGDDTLLFSQGGAQNRPRRIYVANVQAGVVRPLVEPEAIDGAARLIEPDY